MSILVFISYRLIPGDNMSGDIELLNYLYESMDMGIKSLESLAKNLEQTDNKIRSNVLKALEEYKRFSKKCNKKIKEYKVKPMKKDLFTIMMAKMGTNKEFKRDNSDSKIADLLIQGYNMGILEVTKKINRYKNDTSKDIMRLALEYKEMQQKGIEDVKGFL